MDFLVCHPVVKVSIVDGATGYLLQKSGEHLKSEKTVVITKIRNTVHTAGIISFSMYRHLTQPLKKKNGKNINIKHSLVICFQFLKGV